MTDTALTPRQVDLPTRPLIEVSDLSVDFRVRGSRRGARLRAVDGVSFDIDRGRTLGMVGESGSGKSTMGRAILQLERAAEGSVRFEGTDLTTLSGGQLRSYRRRMQMVFQDPFASLNPRMTVGDTVGDSLLAHDIGTRADRRERVGQMLETVGLDPSWAGRFPHEFSGGQRQRIAIARALAVDPDFVVADEPVSALDVSVQAQTINLLGSLQEDLGVTFLFIAHDLAVVRQLAHRVAVVYLGKVVELADRDQLYSSPAHPYTVSLLSAVPIPEPALERRRERIILRGDIPSPMSPPSGCRFRTRCWKAQEVCAEVVPPLVTLRPGHTAACHFPEA
ncbi:ABC transporter ATP-binding protein [Ornithinimicrobium sufpigmenti]|uniref:ABC transporter ATP-binding protein n=1 Tax=Ornithinimicrobium sufpigmenti TaxID=2508882 RepID=UPI0010362915|nr:MULTISPECIES: oligopeptide/dipeptide ABC transporter ATP-binding protein [unclassified Ornithinimicrobium]